MPRNESRTSEILVLADFSPHKNTLKYRKPMSLLQSLRDLSEKGTILVIESPSVLRCYVSPKKTQQIIMGGFKDLREMLRLPNTT